MTAEVTIAHIVGIEDHDVRPGSSTSGCSSSAWLICVITTMAAGSKWGALIGRQASTPPLSVQVSSLHQRQRWR
jgi:hypothetical protein